MKLPSLRLLECSLPMNVSVTVWEKEAAVAERRKLWNPLYKVTQTPYMKPEAREP